MPGAAGVRFLSAVPTEPATSPPSLAPSSSSSLFDPTPEHRLLRETVRRFVETEVEPQANEYNKHERFNVALFRKLGELGLLGITADAEYGGSGMDAVAAVIVHEELSAADPAFCLSYLAHSMLFVNNVSVNGSPAQKAKYLPATCTGEKVAGMCMSEPGAGTDVLGMATRATLAADGAHYVLNGTKMWITNGTVDGTDTGDVFLVYAKTGPARGATDLTAFLVEKGAPGFVLGQKIEDKCGMRASMTAELVFQDVHVPVANVVGTVGGASLCMMRNLEIERVTLAAMSVGIARRCVETMASYAQERKAFGRPIADFGQTQKAIAESYAEYMAGRAYLYHVAGGLDLRKHGQGLDADGVKVRACMHV